MRFQAQRDPQHRRGLGEEARGLEVLAAQKHLWEYYTRVALNRGMQGGRNSGKAMTYGEAYLSRLFPEAVERPRMKPVLRHQNPACGTAGGDCADCSTRRLHHA